MFIKKNNLKIKLLILFTIITVFFISPPIKTLSQHGSGQTVYMYRDVGSLNDFGDALFVTTWPLFKENPGGSNRNEGYGLLGLSRKDFPKTSSGCESLFGDTSRDSNNELNTNIFETQKQIEKTENSVYINLRTVITQDKLKLNTTYNYCTKMFNTKTGAIVYTPVKILTTGPKVTLKVFKDGDYSINETSDVAYLGRLRFEWASVGATSCQTYGSQQFGWSWSPYSFPLPNNPSSTNLNGFLVSGEVYRTETYSIKCKNEVTNVSTIASKEIKVEGSAETEYLDVTTVGTEDNTPLHCFNNKLDDDETAIDRGGSCGTKADSKITLVGKVNNTSDLIGIYGYFRLSKIIGKPPIFCNQIFGSNMTSIMSTEPEKLTQGSNLTFKGTVSGLNPNTTYAYCAVASSDPKSATEIKYGEVKYFTTLPCLDCPHTIISTNRPTEIEINSVKVNGSYNSIRNIKVWFQYRMKGEARSWPHQIPAKGEEKLKGSRNYANFSEILQGLRSNTIYEVQAVAETIPPRSEYTYPPQKFYGMIREFKTAKDPNNPNDDDIDHCENGKWDPEYGETGVDTGGNCNTIDPCENGYQDFGETGVDVGGNCPSVCEEGQLELEEGSLCPAGYLNIQGNTKCCNPEMCEFPGVWSYPDTGGGQSSSLEDRTCICSLGYTGTPPNCEISSCAPGQLQIEEGELCPAGYLGDAPCCDPYNKICPSPGVWSYPETTGGQSSSLDDKICICPSGYDGTPPDCTKSPNPQCKYPEVGTYPNCTCATGYTGTPPDCKKDTPDKVTVTVSADPNPINSGGKSTIKWSSENAESCNASYTARGTGTSGSFQTEALKNNKTYTVTCKGKGGTGSDSVYVRVTKIKVDVVATPKTVDKGKDSTVSWTSQGATHCHSGFLQLLRDDPQKLKYERISIATNELSGSVKVKNITEAQSFTVACGNEYGDYAEDSETITIKGVAPDPNKDKITVTVTAEPKVIFKNQNSKISWSSTNAEKCNASYPDSGEGARTKGTSGSFNVGPLTNSKTYSVTCTGKKGSGSGNAYVQVIKNLITVDVWAKPQSVRKGGNTTIYWKADEKATACDAGVRSASKAPDTSKWGGFSPINLQQSQTYVVTCTGPNEAWGEGKTRVSVGGLPLHCSNGKLDADLGETEVDKGGPCPGGKPSHCYNKVLDADLGETAVDVGGPCGKPAHCYDGVLSGDETEVDKGGSCGGGKPAHCYNGELDADKGETSIDVGGPCGLPAHCYNGVKDADETGIDIGGSCGTKYVPDCPLGWTRTSTGCVGPTKCPTGTVGIFPNCTFIKKCPTGMTGTYPNCKKGPGTCPVGFNFVAPDKCVAITECPEGTKGTYPKCTFLEECPSGTTGTYPNCGKNGPSETGDCSDKIKNGNETGVDTGGRCDPNYGKLCPLGTSGKYPNCVEDGPTTEIDHCINEVQDFGETGIDIGGGCGGVYPKGPNCYDGIKNGDETKIDEGGHCGDDINNKGEFPSCFDNIKNGDETEIDKGGHCGGELKSNRIDIRVPEFKGTGIINGTCKDKAIVGNAIATSPGSSGPFEGVWYAGKAVNTGNIKLNCEDGSCKGTLDGKVICMDGPFVGSLLGGKGDGSDSKKVDWIDMIFNGYSGLGIINGNCVNGVCDIGEFSGIMPEVNGKVSDRWTGPGGTGPFNGECKEGICAGAWSGVITGNNGPVTGTWTGNGANEKIEELYIGYEGMPDVDDIVRYHEGIEHVFIRRIMINTELARKYGYKKGDNLLHFAWKLAHDFAKAFGYVNAEGNEIRVSKPDVSAYQLRQVGDKLTVYEYYKNKIIDIRNTTTKFKDKNSYEYYFEK